MLKLTEDQIRNFAARVYAEFESRVVLYLNEALPNHSLFLGEAGIRHLIRHCTQHAGWLGITDEMSIAKLAYLHAILGRNFDLQPRYQDLSILLSNVNIPIEARMDAALDWVANRLAESQLSVFEA